MRFQTMKSVRIQIVSLLLAGLISMPAHGEVIAGRWEKVSALELGTPITVELKNGDQVEGTFEVLSASEVEVATHFARAVIPKEDIQTIATQKKGGAASGARKGAIIGAATGAAIGVGTLLYTEANRSTGENLRVEVFLLGIPAVVAGIGAALGIAVGAVTQSEAIVVYQAARAP